MNRPLLNLLAALPMLLIALVATVISSASSSSPKAHPLPWVGCDSLDIAVHSNIIDLLVGTNAQTPEGNKTCIFRHTRSRDGGKTWSTPVIISASSRQAVPHHRGSDARIIARGNQLFAAWTTPGTGFHGTGPMGTALSTDGGQTWQAGPDPSDQKSTGSSRFLALAADEHAFHLIWLDDRNKQRGLRHASSTDGGKTWSANATIDDYTCACCWNTMVVGKAGVPGRTGGAETAKGHESSDDSARSLSSSGSLDSSLYVLYRDMKPSDMGLARSTDGGRTWEKLGHVGTYEWLFDGCPHVGGGLAMTESTDGKRQLFAAVWTGKPDKVGCHLLASDDDGRSWLPVRRIGSDTAKHPTLTARGEELCIVWDDLAGDDRAAFFTTSSDAGATWSHPHRLSASERQGSHARVIANPAGDGFIAFWTESTGNEPPVLHHQPLQGKKNN